MSRPRLFLQSTVIPENRFEIIKFDKETRVATLKGKHAEFTEELTQERLDKLRYTVVKEVSDD